MSLTGKVAIVTGGDSGIGRAIALEQARSVRAQIRLGRLPAYVQLYKALGGGWNRTDPQVPPPTAEVQQPSACAGKKC